MPPTRRHWKEELELIDRVMKAISGITDPNEMVETYWNGIDELIPSDHYIAVSRRGVEPPGYLITRASRILGDVNPWRQRDRLPRLQGGLLGEIVYGNRPFIIDDLPSVLAKDDPAYAYLEGFQSLLAFPQYDQGEGLNVGMSLFPTAGEYDPAMIPMMHWQAGLFGRGTQNLVLRNQLSDALAMLDRELQTVGEIQRSLLPRTLPLMPGIKIGAFYQTSARAGGDYYDFFPLGEDEWGIFIADVSGHGTPAAVLMAVTHAIAHTRPGKPKPPSELLAHLNQHLSHSYTASGTFITAFYATLNTRTLELTYCAAGHNPPRLRRRDHVISLDQLGGLPLGIIGSEVFRDATITLEPGDLLLLYTDGITEVMTPLSHGLPRELFGTGRLDQILLDDTDDGPEACIQKIIGETQLFGAATQPVDDQTIIALQINHDAGSRG